MQNGRKERQKMNKHRYNRLAIAIVCGAIIVLVGAIATFAQEKQKIPAEFFEGIFHGVLQGAVWDSQRPRPWRINFTTELYGHNAASLEGVLMPYGLKGSGSVFTLRTMGIPSVYFAEGGKRFYENFDGIYLLFDVGENPSYDVLTVATPFAVKLLDGKVDLDDGAIIIDYVWSEHGGISGFSVKGTLYKVNKIKKIFPKDIKPSEPIKTDEKKQIEITDCVCQKMTRRIGKKKE